MIWPEYTLYYLIFLLAALRANFSQIEIHTFIPYHQNHLDATLALPGGPWRSHARRDVGGGTASAVGYSITPPLALDVNYLIN